MSNARVQPVGLAGRPAHQFNRRESRLECEAEHILERQLREDRRNKSEMHRGRSSHPDHGFVIPTTPTIPSYSARAEASSRPHRRTCGQIKATAKTTTTVPIPPPTTDSTGPNSAA